MIFTEEDKIALKLLKGKQHYEAERFLAEFLFKPRSLRGLTRLIKKIGETGSIARDRRWTTADDATRCDDNIERVEQVANSSSRLRQRERRLF